LRSEPDWKRWRGAEIAIFRGINGGVMRGKRASLLADVNAH
jgi:hypothetical protein